MFNILIGFIIMCILIGISAIPIFVVQHYKKNCNISIKWFLFAISISIYIILSATCQYYGILAERKGIPIPPIIILSILAGINLFHTEKTSVQENIKQNIVKDVISGKNNSQWSKKVYIIITTLIIFALSFLIVMKHINFENKNDNYWEQPYKLNRIEVLNNEIDLFELKRSIPEKSYDDQIKIDGYFYNINLIKDNEYTILFDVWKENNNATKTKIIEDMQCIASMFLKSNEQNKIKVLIRIADKGSIDTENAFNGYISNKIFNVCKKPD